MSAESPEERLERRIADMSANDQEFAAARPIEAVAAAAQQPGLRLPQTIQTVIDGYADRPALGRRAVQFVTDPATGRTSAQLLPRFETITYRELGERVSALASAWAQGLVSPGDRVAVLGFTSVDYATIDIALGHLGAVSVPLQTSAAITQLLPIVVETEPVVIASSIDSLADAVELIQTGHTPAQLVVFDYQQEVDDQRDALDAARAQLAGGPVVVETLAEVLQRAKALPPTPPALTDDPNPLALLIYTSGSTGAPKGAMYPQENVAKMWKRASKNWFGPTAASISLNFMPMSHIMGRGSLYGTLGNGGTAYFSAKSDLSTLLEDLALVRPTEMMFVPRIWEMLFSEFQSQVDHRSGDGADRSCRRSRRHRRTARARARRAVHLRDDRLRAHLP